MIRDQSRAQYPLMLTVPIEAVMDGQAAGTGYWLTGSSSKTVSGWGFLVRFSRNRAASILDNRLGLTGSNL